MLRGPHAALCREAIVVVALAVLAVFTAVRYIPTFRATGEKQVFYQETFGPAVMQACGRGFVNPAPQAVPGLDSFLAAQTDSFDCRAVPQYVATLGLTPMQEVSRYLQAASTLCFRVLGVRWSALDWLSAGLYAATAVTFYLALRLVCGPILSVSLAVMAIVSPLQLAYLPHIRDYSKAPFFVAGAAGLAWIVAPRRPRSIFAAAFAIGALTGIGIGFRTDVMLYLPPFVAGLLVCTPDGSPSPWRIRAGACALCLGACLAISWPILRVYSSGQGLWHVALLGLTPPHDRLLGIQPSVYEFGDQYRDGYVNTVATSYWMRTHHTPVGDPQTYAAATGEYYRRLFTTFPADFVTRSWAAVLKSLNLPGDLNVARLVPYGVTAGWLENAYRYRWWLLSWVDGLALPLLIAIAIGLSMRRWRAAVCLLGFVAFSAGITSLQFQPRHFFHLEMMVYWIFAAALGGLASVLSHWKLRLSAAGSAGGARALPAFILAAVLVAIVVLPIVVLRAYQSRSVSALLRQYESAPMAPVGIHEKTSQDVAFLGIAPPTSTSTAPSARMIVTTLDSSRCGDSVDLTFRYIADPAGQYDFTRLMHVDSAALAANSKVFLPAYYSIDAVARVEFVGLEVPERQRACIRSVSRFSNADAFPLLLTTLLPASWQNRPLYERIDPLEFHPSMITPFVGKAWYRTRRILHL